MYYLLAGRPPFDADNWAQAMIANAQIEPSPPSSIDGIDVPNDVEAIVMRCLAKDPKQRYADGGELAKALAESKSK
jgi:serine/threonine-protein kinase